MKKWTQVELLVAITGSSQMKTHEEIAKILKRSRSSVKTKMSRLKEVMSPESFCKKIGCEYDEKQFDEWAHEARKIVEMSSDEYLANEKERLQSLKNALHSEKIRHGERERCLQEKIQMHQEKIKEYKNSTI